MTDELSDDTLSWWTFMQIGYSLRHLEALRATDPVGPADGSGLSLLEHLNILRDALKELGLEYQ